MLNTIKETHTKTKISSHPPEWLQSKKKKKRIQDFPGGTVDKNPPANAGGKGLIPGPGRPHMPRRN